MIPINFPAPVLRKRLALESKFLAACDRLNRPTFYTYSAKARCGEIEHSRFGEC
jgi:hypothetical protein